VRTCFIRVRDGKVGRNVDHRPPTWKERPLAKKTVRVSDMSGQEIPDGKGSTARTTFQDARKGARELDLTDAEAERLGGRAVARRGRRPGSRAKAQQQ
jgi:hypothetical protein